MKTSTLLIIAAAALLLYLLWRHSQAATAASYSAPIYTSATTDPIAMSMIGSAAPSAAPHIAIGSEYGQTAGPAVEARRGRGHF